MAVILKAKSEAKDKSDGKPSPEKIGDGPRFLLYFLIGIVVLSIFSGGEKIQGMKFLIVNFRTWSTIIKSKKPLLPNALSTARLKVEDKKIGKHFYTIPLWDEGLVKNLQEHKVEYVVRSGDNWLSNHSVQLDYSHRHFRRHLDVAVAAHDRRGRAFHFESRQ